ARDAVEHARRLAVGLLRLLERAAVHRRFELLDGVVNATLAPAVDRAGLLVLTDALLGRKAGGHVGQTSIAAWLSRGRRRPATRGNEPKTTATGSRSGNYGRIGAESKANRAGSARGVRRGV